MPDEWSGSTAGVGTMLAMSCPYCGCYPKHGPERCPRVAAIEYHPNFGGIKRIEFR
jgi:hypothetical protein